MKPERQYQAKKLGSINLMLGDTEDKEYKKSLEWLVKHSSKKDLKRMFEEPKEPYVRDVKIGRNDPCPCGSGKKYKKCCGRFL